VSRVAIVTCRGEDVDPDSPLLLAALARANVASDLVIWDDPAVRWTDYDLVVLRSTWDYAGRRDEFLTWAKSVPTLVNPYPVVVYSTDKHYFGDLLAQGLAVVPSQFCDVGETPTFPEGDFVIKPCVGAGSIEADRYRADEHERARAHVARLHAMGRDVVIQPYVSAVDVMGERALIFIDGQFSHAMTKGAMLNVSQLDRNALFRREQMSRAEAEPDALALAHAVLAHGGWDQLLYARVDMVRTETGWALMELELVEPSLFLAYDDAAADKLANAIARRLAN
jgi:hypothetical protein